VHLLTRKRIIRSWGIGAVISLMVVLGTIFGTHTPLQVVAFLPGLPLFVIALAITTGRHPVLDYMLMVLAGSLFYGLVWFLAETAVLRLRSRTGATSEGRAGGETAGPVKGTIYTDSEIAEFKKRGLM